MAERFSRMREITGRYERLAGSAAEYRLDTTNRLVRVKFGKIVTEMAIHRYVESLRVNPEFSPSFSEIVDLSEVETIDLNGEQLINLADHVDPFAPDAKRAFVVQNASQKHEARMYGIMRMARDKIQTFDSAEEAEEWVLGNGNQ